jgi:hypothetical protein
MCFFAVRLGHIITHRRVYLRDLLAHKEHRDHERHLAINRISTAAGPRR